MSRAAGGPELHCERLASATAQLTKLEQRRARLVEQRDREIVALSRLGLSLREISELCGLTRGRVGQIVQSRTRALRHPPR